MTFNGKTVEDEDLRSPDLEVFLSPGVEFAEQTGIKELARTTAMKPDCSKLMEFRIRILQRPGCGLKEIQETIARIRASAEAEFWIDWGRDAACDCERYLSSSSPHA